MKDYGDDDKNDETVAKKYLSAPASLRTVELELIPDEDIFILWESMRGGAFYIFKRYSKANNMHLKYYDLKHEWK